MSSFSRKDVEMISRDRRWDGFYKLDQMKLRHKRFDGSWTGVLDREVLERKHVVAVIPYDPIQDKVVLIEQFRPCTLSTSEVYPNLPNWLIEIVAGIINDGEDEEDVAHRETKEEIGLKIKQLIPVSHFFSSQGCTSEAIKLYCAIVEASEAEGLFGLNHEDEDIRAFTVSVEEAMSMVTSGKICNATAILALQWLMLNKDSLPQS